MAIERFELLLLIIAVVAALTRLLRLPYSIGFVVAGIAVALSPIQLQIHLTKELVFNFLLPPLIFEAAFVINWNELRRDLGLITTLATLGVIVSAGVTAVGMHWLAAWPWSAAIVFGTLIAATDPVSVVAAFKEARFKGRLRLLVESESLFNDGTAAVLFAIVTALFTGQAMSVGGAALQFLVMIGGGVLCGALVGGVVLVVSRHAKDHLVEITFTLVAAYGSFLLAERFHCSGVLATLTTALVLGNVGPLSASSTRGRAAVLAFWEYTAFLVNAVVFLLIGLHEVAENFVAAVQPGLIAALLVLVGRAVAIYPTCLLFARGKSHVPILQQHVLFWGGLRGALALALALGLPETIEGRDTVITVVFFVVTVSIVLQGLTMSPVLARIQREK